MPYTVKPINKQGTLEIRDDSGTRVGVGRAKKSSVDGMITLTLSLPSYNFIALRLPIDWVTALGEVDDATN